MTGKVSVEQKLPVVLIIAGFDTCSGAGIVADLFAVASHGGYGLAAISSIVSQSSRKVDHAQAVSPTLFTQELDCLLGEYDIAAIKIGLLPQAQLIEIAAEKLTHLHAQGIPIVVDPVMVASAGTKLIETKALLTLREKLLPLTSLLTPNLEEARALSQQTLANESAEALDAWSLSLREELGCDLLLKGGHLDQELLTDRLVTAEGIIHFSAPKLSTPASHGTGCRLSSAIAACLARTETLPQAVAQAREFVRNCLIHSLTLPSPTLTEAKDHHHLGMMGNAYINKKYS